MSVARQGSVFVLGDWGASRLRLFLSVDGEITQTRTGPGIAESAAPTQTLIDLLAPWRHAHGVLDIYLAGMVGSRNGIHEVAYVPLPADCVTWSRACWSTAFVGATLSIAGGLYIEPGVEPGDVMRGEETQIFGALRLDPTLAQGRAILVLPGTHSKWVHMEDGRVIRFRTALTGETYALLRTHSTLLRASSSTDQADDMQRGFDFGVERAAQLAEGLLAALFETRVQQLLAGRSHAWASAFLSGLLIAHEIDSVGRTFAPECAVTVIGDPQLAALYRSALATRGRTARVLAGDACVIEGLLYLAACLRSQ